MPTRGFSEVSIESSISRGSERRDELPGVKNAIKGVSLHCPPGVLTAVTRPERLMPRLQTRLIATLALPLAVACNAPSNQPAYRASAGEAGGIPVALASTATRGKSSADSSIEETVAAVTKDVVALRNAPPAVAADKLPAHEQLVTGMLNTFESRIRAMHVQADPAWSSVIDSVRTDLVRLPTMPSSSLATFLPQHLNRVMRIVACIQMVKS